MRKLLVLLAVLLPSLALAQVIPVPSTNLSGTIATTMKGLTGVQGFSVEPAPGKITVTIRDSSALGVEYFNTLEDADVVVEFRNGKTWIGTGMWQVGEVGVTAKESEIKLTLEGPDVTETGATGATAP